MLAPTAPIGATKDARRSLMMHCNKKCCELSQPRSERDQELCALRASGDSAGVHYNSTSFPAYVRGWTSASIDFRECFVKKALFLILALLPFGVAAATQPYTGKVKYLHIDSDGDGIVLVHTVTARTTYPSCSVNDRYVSRADVDRSSVSATAVEVVRISWSNPLRALTTWQTRHGSTTTAGLSKILVTLGVYS